MKYIFYSLFLVSLAFGLSEEEIKEAYYRSYHYEKIGRYEDAIKALLPVYREYPEGYTVNLRLGWLFYLDRKYANSIFHYEKTVKIASYSIEAKLGYTLPLLAQEKYENVEKICYQILNIDFYNYYGNLRLSYVLRKQGKNQLAEKIIRKILLIYPTDVKFLTELALVFYQTGQKDKAKNIFKDILILDPENQLAKKFLNQLLINK